MRYVVKATSRNGEFLVDIHHERICEWSPDLRLAKRMTITEASDALVFAAGAGVYGRVVPESEAG